MPQGLLHYRNSYCLWKAGHWVLTTVVTPLPTLPDWLCDTEQESQHLWHQGKMQIIMLTWLPGVLCRLNTVMRIRRLAHPQSLGECLIKTIVFMTATEGAALFAGRQVEACRSYQRWPKTEIQLYFQNLSSSHCAARVKDHCLLQMYLLIMGVISGFGREMGWQNEK